MRDRASTNTVIGRRIGFTSIALLFAVLAGLQAMTLLYNHSLHSIDGAMQTWFALSNFADGNQLGREFQSYLGITMILALLPVYWALGESLFASTLAAYLMVMVGAFAAAYALAWLMRPIAAGQRAIAAIVVVFGFYYLGSWTADLIGLRYPLSFDPGHSLRPVRAALPILVLPFFVALLRKALAHPVIWPGTLLGVIAGVGLLWSNDAGIPLIIAMVMALTLALYRTPAKLVRTIAGFAAGTFACAFAILMFVTHGEPSGWLHYNFRDVAGDQFWYFAPWDRSTRILGVADLPMILVKSSPLTAISLVLLGLSMIAAIIQRLRGRGSPVRGAALIFVGSSVAGTALVPQIGGHVGGGYSDITFLWGLCAPLILAQRWLMRLAKPVMRRIGAVAWPFAAMIAATFMIVSEASSYAAVSGETQRTAFAPSIGFYVTPDFNTDLQAMQRLGAYWESQGLPEDSRMLSVYTSALDIAAGTQSAAPVGSLIHALGHKNRAFFNGLVADRSVEAVTTIAPDYTGWEGWNLRANWPFFREVFAKYQPIARNDQHVIWVRSEGIREPVGDATCTATPVAGDGFDLTISASAKGLAAITVTRAQPFAQGRSALLSVTETSPFTQASQASNWIDFPRYGIANTATLELVAPVDFSSTTTLRLEVMDGSAIGSAACTAVLHSTPDLTTLPSLPTGIDAYIARGGS